MDAPSLTPLMTLQLTLHPNPIGATPFGTRTEIAFSGTATSTHWDGEWSASGIDHIRRSPDGIAQLDVHAVVTDGNHSIAYRGNGRSSPAGVLEGVTFETASETFDWLNASVGVGRGQVNGDQLTVELFILNP